MVEENIIYVSTSIAINIELVGKEAQKDFSNGMELL
jgi:hypothetical protein